MVFTKGRANWFYISIVAVSAAAAGGGIIFFQRAWLSEELAFLNSSFTLKPVHLLKEIDENFLTQVNECFFPTAAVYGYELRITSGFRTLAEQDQLFDQGRTENGHIVSWAPEGKSLHNYGFAVDVVDRWDGYSTDWKRLGKIGAFCGLEQVDDPHFEHRSGLTTEQFGAGMMPPLLALPCPVMAERAKSAQPLTLADLKACGAPDF